MRKRGESVHVHQVKEEKREGRFLSIIQTESVSIVKIFLFFSTYFSIINIASHDKESPNQENLKLGRPLRDYRGLSPISNKLKADIEKVTKLGQSVSLRCMSLTKPLEKCSWRDPLGFEFDANQPPVGITTLINDEQTCQIQIDSITEHQLGKWTCKIELADENQFQEATLTATLDILVRDVRLPVHAKPEIYVLHLTPFIIADNYTIEGRALVN